LVTFAEKITKLCNGAGFAVTRIKDKTGINVSRATANAWITRGARPRPETMKALADYFGVPVEWLTDDSKGFEFDPEAADPMNEKMKELWSRMTIVQRAELLVKAVEILG